MTKRPFTLLVAGSAGTVSLGLSVPAAAITDDQRLEKLEQLVGKLEKRLEASEAENAKLKHEISNETHHAQASAHRGGNLGRRLGYEESPPAPSAQDYQKLETKLKNLEKSERLLERKVEIDKEVADNSRKSAAKVEAGPNGFKIGTADGDWQLRLRGFLQSDTNTFFNDNPAPGTGIGWNPTLGADGEPNPYYPGAGLSSDKFWIRRARLQFAGTIAKHLDFLIAPDFAGSQTRLFDAWTDFHYYQPLSLAVGKMKGPQDLERLQNATNLIFNERAYPTQLAANRQIGAMIHGEIEGPGFDTKYISNISHTQELFSYQLGIFNGSQDNQDVGNSNSTNFDNKEYAGRIFAHPFRHIEFEPIQRLGIGMAGNYTDWQGAGANATTPMAALVSQGQANILSYQGPQTVPSATNTNVTQTINPITGNGGSTSNPKVVTNVTTTTNYSAAFLNGAQTHLAPQGYWYWGPFGIMSDWTQTTQGISANQATTTVTQVQSDVNGTTNIASGGQTPGTRTTTVTTSTTAPRQAAQISQTNTAWQVAASYVLTGEENTYWAIKPAQNFDPLNGYWGAWQVVARWHELDIGKNTFTNIGSVSNPIYPFADPRNSVSHAQTWGLGLNWFLNSNVKIQGNYEQTQFTGGAVNANNQVTNRPDEKVFFTRVQFWY